MNTPYLYIILIAILALSIAIFQYIYQAKKLGKKEYAFAILRFLSLFLLGVLLLNPKFNQKTQRLIKPNLVVAIDNSNSILKLKQNTPVLQLLNAIKTSNLSQKFNIQYYRFGKNITPLDSLTFTETQTNISNVFKSLKSVYQNTNSPLLLVTDGNQTFGTDYVLQAQNYKQPIYPIVLGDSILKTDIKISHIQHNKYAFLGNEFPVEITLSYIGEKPISQILTVSKNKVKVFRKNISFSKNNNTKTVSFTLKANSVGKQYYTATITPLSSEKNTKNNTRNFSISVIDERTKVLLISSILHPDLGALKKAIESNKQRKVTLVKPTDNFNINAYQMVIVYQPNAQFKTVFEKIEKFQKNYFVITGLHTDWVFLNNVSSYYHKKAINQKQEYLSRKNDAFNLFQYDPLAFETFPPLQDYYGDLQLKKQVNTLLYQQIGRVETQTPLLSFFENANNRTALLTGEGIWKWRAKSFTNTQNFETFDVFIGKTVQFLASNTKKQRLVVDVKDEFYLGESRIDAQYFDKNYQFDANALVKATLVNVTTKQKIQYDFSNGKSNYILNLDNLSAGKYQYTVQVLNEGLAKKGSFEVLDFNIEAQFLNTNVIKLRQVAINPANKLYFSGNYKALFKDLEKNEQFKPVQKEEITQKSLIDWQYLLGIILLLLAIEWLLRKYNGLL